MPFESHREGGRARGGASHAFSPRRGTVSRVDPHDELATLLRPAGGGLHLVSTGKKEQLALQERLYGATGEREVRAAFERTLRDVGSAKAFVLGIPSDVGAGFRRGANLGPQAIREGLVASLGADGEGRGARERLAERGVVDVGDVFVVPQLLSDDMLSEAQLERSQKALYPDVAAHERARLPVSPLSIAERAMALLLGLAPNAAPIALGGDHSTAYPVARELLRAREARGERLAVVQSDAHTDLLDARLGITHCFATWSFHINEALGRDGRLVQVGIRASGRDKAHWESTLGVKQLWADEVNRDEAAALEAIVSHLERLGTTCVYFSNDIDGTDSAFASATGTPEPFGLRPDFLVALIRQLGRKFSLVGGDVMEVAPPLGEDASARKTTVDLAVRYLRETLEAVLGAPL